MKKAKSSSTTTSWSAKLRSQGLWLLAAMPVALPAALCSLSLLLVMLLVLGQLSTALTILLGGPLFMATFWYVAKRSADAKRLGSLREQRIFDLIVLVGVVLWGLTNMYYATQSVFVYRDPAIYAVTGIELKDNQKLDLKTPQDFGAVPGLEGNSAGFGKDKQDPERIVPQGLRLLPIYIGLTARLGGEALALSINPIFGAIGLLAMYGFARLLVKPRWAVLSVGIMGLSLPLIYFSRDTFSEPLLLISTFAGLSLLYLAQKQQKLGLWILAGAALGSGALARIDGFLSFIMIVGFLVVYLAYQNKERLKQLTFATSFLAAIGVASLISYLDLTKVGNNYQSLTRQKMLMAFIGVVIIGAVMVVIAWKTPILKLVQKLNRQILAIIAVVLVLATGLFLASRPLWYEGHHSKKIPLVAGLQRAAGEPIDITRDYSEETVSWIVWYIGPIAALLGGLGLVVCTVKIIKDDRTELLPLVLITCGTALVFLTKPSITPDQIWATRRLLPVIIPGVVVLAAVGFSVIDDLRAKHKLARLSLWPLVILAVIPPLFISWPFLSVKLKAGQLHQIQTFCNNLPDNAAVLWLGTRGFNAVQATNTYCGVPTARMTELTADSLETMNNALEQQNKQLVVAAFSTEPEALEGIESKQRHEITANYLSVGSTLHHPPRRITQESRTVIMLVEPMGRSQNE